MPEIKVYLRPTPAGDLRGDGATSPVPYNNLRPTIDEPMRHVEERTEIIQRAIDAASKSGGGRVRLPAGLYQCNQIVKRSRVAVTGEGESATVLLDSGMDERPANDLGFVTSENYGEFNDRFQDDPATAPKWLEDGAVVHLGLQDLTIDGNGYDLADSPEWNIGERLKSPNLGTGRGGVTLLSSGLRMDNVRIQNCDGNGATISRGHKKRQGHYTTADDPSTQIGRVEIQNCNAKGMHITNHPDGTLERLNVSNCGDAGLTINGKYWGLTFIHAWACRFGVQNYGTNFYSQLETEYCRGYGAKFFLSGSDHTAIVNQLVMFNNAREGSNYLVIQERVIVNGIFLKMMQNDNRTGIIFGPDASQSKIHGVIRIDQQNPPSGNTLVDMNNLGASGRLDLDLKGDINGARESTVLKMRGASKANRIVLDFSGYGDQCKIVDATDGAGNNEPIDGSNRIQVYAPESAIPYTPYHSPENGPEIEIIEY